MNKEEHLKRDLDLENIVGNLLIAEYQVEKLKSRLADNIVTKYGNNADKKHSTHISKNNGKWIRVSLTVEDMTVNNSVYIQEME